MTVQTSTGTLFAIVQANPATEDQPGYAALSWVNVGEVTDVPEFGASTAKVEHKPLATGVVEKLKGFIDYGSFSLALGRDTSDAGQVLLKSASDGASKFLPHSMRVTLQDGTLFYFKGGVFSYTVSPGSADSVVSSTSLVESNSVIVEA